MILRIIIQIIGGVIVGGIYRIARYFETKNIVTLVVGLLTTFTGIGNFIAWVVDLVTLIANGKALEINTSGLRQPIGKTMPTENYVRRFRELGGEFLTLGSDAHFTEHVGAGIDEGYAIAESCGFEYVTYFENRKPVQVKIEK